MGVGAVAGGKGGVDNTNIDDSKFFDTTVKNRELRMPCFRDQLSET